MAATLVANGTTCTLANAIAAANADHDLGGCVAGGAYGADTITLAADVTLTSGDPASAGLPVVTSEVTIVAGTGHVLERDAARACQSPADDGTFRLLSVAPSGALTLDGITLRNGCVLPAPPASGPLLGGAVLVDGGTLVLRNVTASGNVVVDDAQLGSVAQGGAVAAIDHASVTIDGSTFTENVASGGMGRPGGVGTPADGGDAAGGAVAVDGATLVELRDSTFTGNRAAGGSGAGVGPDFSPAGNGGSAAGGAVALEGTDGGEITGCVFAGNTAEGGNGGAIQGSFAGNASGGGLAVSDSSTALLARSIFRDNVARGGLLSGGGGTGGGAFVTSGTLTTIADCLFAGNEASSRDSSGSGIGGGLAATATIATLASCTFDANVAAGVANAYGGGLYNRGTIEVAENLTFDGNRASAPFAQAPVSGGALANDFSLPSLRHVTMVGNVVEGPAGSAGGGIGGSLAWRGSLAVDDAILARNRAIVDGGATASDCDDANGATVTSQGYNLVQAPGACAFAATGDVVGIDAEPLPVAENGCASALPDGSCLPTVMLAVTSPAIDAGSCGEGASASDARGLARPQDLAAANAADGCDIGALEVQPADPPSLQVDGFESGDLGQWAASGGAG